MAPIPGRNRLTCYYCGVKSSKKQDGYVRQWECKNCASVNYLDQNGEITDPPAHVFSSEPSPPPPMRFARKIEEPAFVNFTKPQTAAESPFCETCLRNQHMYHSLLSQYEPQHMGVDPARPYAPDRTLLQYKKSLQAQYPQVCADCQRGVDERIKKANRMAQAEALRHKLNSTKTTHEGGRTRTWVERLALWGGVIYWVATAGQILVCLTGLLDGTIPTISKLCLSTPLSMDESAVETIPRVLFLLSPLICPAQIAVPLCKHISTRLPLLEFAVVLLTIVSLWWNPYFRNMIRGFDRHIHGFYDWYRYQIILLITRIVFWTFMGRGQFSNSDASATTGLNAFTLIITVLIAYISRKSITVDYRKLFPNTKESYDSTEEVVIAAQTSVYRGSGMAAVLDGIASEPSRAAWSPPNQNAKLGTRYTQHSTKQSSPTRLQSSSPVQRFMSEMNEDEAANWLTRGELPSHMRQDVDDNAMEWSPSQQRNSVEFAPRPRQFQSASPPPATTVDQNPFWYKVPAAPVPPSHKGRKPFQKPLFQPASEEKKGNFFNSMTGRQVPFAQPIDEIQKTSAEVDFAPPKFFAQKTFESTGLEELMEKSFSLKSAFDPSDVTANHDQALERTTNVPGTSSYRRDWKIRLAYVLVLTLSFGTWNLAFTSETLDTKSIALGILAVCLAFAVRTLMDNSITEFAKQNPGPRTAIPMVLGGFEAAFAGYAGLGILVAPSVDANWQTKGGLLVAAMWVQEVWLLLF